MHEGKEIVYIEYCDGIPHSVTTADPNSDFGIDHFDFDFIGEDRTNIMWYNSGGGGSKKQLQAPHFVDRRGKRYWMAEGAKFQGRTQAKNCKRIDRPLSIRGWRKRSINPFKVANETSYGFEWCKVCKQHSADGEGCPDHQKWSQDEGCLVYLHDGSRVE